MLVGVVGGTNLSEEEIATRRAERLGEAGGLGGDFQTITLIGSVVRLVVRLLEDKTGVERFDINYVFALVAEETGLSIEDLQSKQGEGMTLAEIITAEGGMWKRFKRK